MQNLNLSLRLLFLFPDLKTEKHTQTRTKRKTSGFIVFTVKFYPGDRDLNCHREYDTPRTQKQKEKKQKKNQQNWVLKHPWSKVTSLFHRIFDANRATQRQFSENICSEDDLRSRFFETFVVKFLSCRPLLGFSNI